MDTRRISTVAFILFALIAPTARAFDAEVPFPSAKLRVADVVSSQAAAFDLRDVRLLDGPFQHAEELDRQYLLSLDPEWLLRNFRLTASLPSAAKPLGGWEEPKGELRGHFVGHYLSACALMYASTGDPRLKAKGDAVVAGMAECQAKLAGGYLSAFPENFFDRLEAGKSVWAPYYTLHKIFAGLMDMYVYCDNQQALEVCKKFGDWAIARNSRLDDQHLQRIMGTEHGGMNEALANLYALTGEEKYLKLSQRFNHMEVLGPASKREDRLTGLHANTQFPKFIGAAREYELTGQPWLKTAVSFFWDNVVKERSYAIGGNSTAEHFTPKDKLSQTLSNDNMETCNSYNMLKLTRHLFCWAPQPEYADYYERALYNHILASQNPQTGMVCYFVPMKPGSQKGYTGPLDTFTCCMGTGIENHAKYGDSIYFHGDKTLYVNLFIPSELKWKTKGLTLRQETRYPDEGRTRLVFSCRQPLELNLRIRRPGWASEGFQLRLNGQTQPLASVPGSYVSLDRVWANGDTVEVAMPLVLRTEGFRDNPRRLAFLNGPLVLAAEVAAKGPFPVLVAEEGKAAASLKPVPGRPSTFSGPPEVFRIPGDKSGRGVTLEPFYKVHGRPYTVYFDAVTPAK